MLNTSDQFESDVSFVAPSIDTIGPGDGSDDGETEEPGPLTFTIGQKEQADEPDEIVSDEFSSGIVFFQRQTSVSAPSSPDAAIKTSLEDGNHDSSQSSAVRRTQSFGPIKKFRFADTEGEPLENVWTFGLTPVGSIDSPMNTPAGQTPGAASSLLARIFNMTKHQAQPNHDPHYIELLFPEPLSDYSALNSKLQLQHVVLESISYRNSELRGLVRVRNLAFEKYVSVRVTFDKWKTFSDWTAEILPSLGHHSDFDIFDFRVPVPPHLSTGSEIQFCVCYKFGPAKEELWDNNCGKNYSLRFCTSMEPDQLSPPMGGQVTVSPTINYAAPKVKHMVAVTQASSPSLFYSSSNKFINSLALPK